MYSQRKIFYSFWVFSLVGLLCIIFACKTVRKKKANSPVPITKVGNTTPTGSDDPYAQNCASCHGALATSTKLGRTSEQIKNALAAVSAMSFLKLPDDVVLKISQLLGGNNQVVATGEELYGSYCAGCHLSLSNTFKKGASVSEIKGAISKVTLMQSLKLTDDELSKISQTLLVDPAVLQEPNFLYKRKCQSCHLELESSQKQNASISQISHALNFVAEMQHLTLSSGQIEKLAELLKTAQTEDFNPKPVLGDRLYVANVFFDLFAERDTSAIASIIQKRILSQAIFFGGLCRPNIDSGCPLNSRQSSVAPDRTVKANPSVNVARRSNIITACEEILNIDSALELVLKKSALDSQSEISQENIKKLAATIFPNLEIVEKYTQTATALGAAVNSRSGVKEAWRFVSKQFCASDLLEVL